jgi:hypothetical protein
VTKDSDPPDPPRDAARALILARRRSFIATALASVALTSCDRNPLVCLEMAVPSIEPTPSAAASASASAEVVTEAPRPCLDVSPPEPPDEGQSGAPSTAPPTPTPRVCLSRRPPQPPPTVCLRRPVP